MFPKRLVQILIICVLLLAALPVLQASADSPALGINIAEQINSANRYDPTQDGTGGVLATVTPAPTSSGTITITNKAQITLTDVNVQFVPGQTSGWTFDTSAGSNKVTLGTATLSSGVVTVHIPQLAAGQHAVVTYTVSSTVASPVLLTTSYSDNKVMAINGASTTVTLTATRNDAVANAGDTITGVQATSTAGTGWSVTPLTSSFADLNSVGAHDSKTLAASIADVTKLTGPANSVTEYLMDTTSLAFTVTSSTGTSAGVSVEPNGISAKTGNIAVDISKQLDGQNWDFTPHVSITDGDPITYTLSAVSMWVTSSNDLGTQVGTNPITLSPTVDLTGTAGNDAWTGATWTWTPPTGFTGVPVGFMQPSISIKNTGTQISVSQTTSGTSTLYKYIYVVNGYLVEVVKTVTAGSTAGQYHIKIVASNMGNLATPPHVVVYDIVPTAFIASDGSSPTNIKLNGNSYVPTTQNLASKGLAYIWDIGALAAKGQTGYQATIDYDVTGTGTYSTTDLYVVGVDPAQSVNLQSTPALQTNATVVNSNLESVMAVGAFCLVLIGLIGTVRRKF